MLVKPDERKDLNLKLHGLVKDLFGMTDEQLIGAIEAGKATVSTVAKLAGQEATVTFIIAGPQKLPPKPE